MGLYFTAKGIGGLQKDRSHDWRAFGLRRRYVFLPHPPAGFVSSNSNAITLKKKDQSHLARASRVLYQELEGVLYQDFSLWTRHVPSLETILQGLERNPHRYSLISELLLSFGDPLPATLVAPFSLFLRHLTNLRHLILKTQHQDCKTLLHGCTFQLYRLDSNGYGAEHFPTFFASRPQIRHLEVQFKS